MFKKIFVAGVVVAGLLGLIFGLTARADDTDYWKTFLNDTGAGTEIIDADEINNMYLHMTGSIYPRAADGSRSTLSLYSLGSSTYPWRSLTVGSASIIGYGGVLTVPEAIDQQQVIAGGGTITEVLYQNVTKGNNIRNISKIELSQYFNPHYVPPQLGDVATYETYVQVWACNDPQSAATFTTLIATSDVVTSEIVATDPSWGTTYWVTYEVDADISLYDYYTIKPILKSVSPIMCYVRPEYGGTNPYTGGISSYGTMDMLFKTYYTQTSGSGGDANFPGTATVGTAEITDLKVSRTASVAAITATGTTNLNNLVVSGISTLGAVKVDNNNISGILQLKADHIAENTSFHNVVFDNDISVDHVIEKTTNHGVSIEGVLLQDATISTAQGATPNLAQNATQLIVSSAPTYSVYLVVVSRRWDDDGWRGAWMVVNGTQVITLGTAVNCDCVVSSSNIYLKNLHTDLASLYWSVLRIR